MMELLHNFWIKITEGDVQMKKNLRYQTFLFSILLFLVF